MNFRIPISATFSSQQTTVSMARACLFVRVSTNRQDYERQITDLSKFCEQKNFAIVKTIATKVTGTKTFKDRDDLKELFEDASKRMFDKVIVAEISRLGRNAKDIRHTIDYLHTRKIALVFPNLGGMESLDESGNESFVTNVIVSLYAELAQEEKKILSERVKSGLNHARKRGIKLGRPKGKEDEEKFLRR